MIEQDAQQSSEKVVQSCKKGRSAEEKIGRLKYNQFLLKRCDSKLDQVLDELRWVRHRLDRIGEADYEVSDVEHWAVVDQVDREILQRVLEAGFSGVLPQDVAADVNKRGTYGYRYYDVSRRIVRMNKRLYFETGKLMFEKRGHRWALTRFAFDTYGETDVGNGQRGGECNAV